MRRRGVTKPQKSGRLKPTRQFSPTDGRKIESIDGEESVRPAVTSIRRATALSSLSGASFDEKEISDRPSMPVRLLRAARASKTWRRVVGALVVLAALSIGLGHDRTLQLFRSVSSFGTHVRTVFTRNEVKLALAHSVNLERANLERRPADTDFDRSPRSPIAGGVFTVPDGFSSPDGIYDVFVHFHGNTDLVQESLSRSGLNVLSVLVNLGVGSGKYEDRFSHPDAFPSLLQRIHAQVEKRGLEEPKRGRVVLSAWSAGYGAVLRILEQPRLARRVDGVLLLDGIHAGYLPGPEDSPKPRQINTLLLQPFEKFAKLASERSKFFFITHSNIDPISYAGTAETTNALLERLGLTRTKARATTVMPKMASMKGVLPGADFIALELRSQADVGHLHVRGYGGDGPNHHMMHLIQMSELVLPEVKDWLERGRSGSETVTQR